jgi:hypothetical protein
MPIRQMFFYADDQAGEIAVGFGADILTLFRYDNNLYKPFFHPVNTVDGIAVTRGFPLDPNPGEPVDHPHQTGMWFNFGDVNGYDFWNNSDSIPAGKRGGYGRIIADSVWFPEDSGRAAFMCSSKWIGGNADTLLQEVTKYLFEADPNGWTMTRFAELQALKPVVLTDNKEGLFAIRMAREFQSDSGKSERLLDAALIPAMEKTVNDQGKSGYYSGSNGLQGPAVWGTRNKWVALQGIKDNDTIQTIIFDHPLNPGFPACWHARDYGLFAVNNLGRSSFSPALEPFSMQLSKNQKIRFIHRITLRSGKPYTSEKINELHAAFSEFSE